MDYLIKNKILSMPNYIKIDVDGIEHLILQGATECLNNSDLKSICVEINDSLTTQGEIIKIMDKYNFKMKHKKISSLVRSVEKYSTIYNYVFER